MHQLFSRWFSVLAVLCCLGIHPVQAAPASAADTKAVRLVIQSQLNAFAADDATRAFSYAAPAIRTQFGDAEHFMAMVRAGYPMVYRPGAVSFFKPELIGSVMVQMVKFSDLAGAEWVATYRLQRQRNKSWRISACEIAPGAGLTT